MFQTMYGKMVVTHDVEVRNIQYDSRAVGPGDLFVAIRGGSVDGHAFIGNAVSAGAKVVVMENDAALPDAFFMHAGVIKVVVSDARKSLALIAGNYYEHPSRKLRLVGVTGTNGKTSTAYLIRSILEANGEKTGLIGTIEYRIGNEVFPAIHTTPESPDLNRLLATMVQKGCTAAVMEVSSHALALRRVFGLTFTAAVFTNLTQDHLDFHQTIDEYFKAKKILFDQLDAEATAIANADSSDGERIIADTKARPLKYGIRTRADVTASRLTMSLSGTSCTVNYRNTAYNVESTLIGSFNVQNILAAYTTGVALSIDHDLIRQGVAGLKAVPGRFQQFASPKGWIAIVDYAHTPDALEKCLRTIREIGSSNSGRIITVFGCGGNRDRSKRPHMGRIATELSDVTVITSDNPRRENPEDIIAEIKAGCVAGKQIAIEPDRRKAISSALMMAQKNDIVLIAGKGHEDYQIVGDTKSHFDDREEVKSFIGENR
ncbi:MAG: UDP-N-acetylmuramoyl-L-alanyl-D-glutamate--2,6-diaminopimelate ligase [Bacteroidetes bacterium]|nr:UDP-N-acetylmuramoyl-L-alanyl-D-glutamate--2,6-diaminopimelate ligase [Bacteroidota bacterium]MCW5894610.1 UDP-N-acetylmuramoyl-L-alanyl-D-glutamate--2,6-diaminopimelate ligase [Bacteroidota bacterium]